MILHNYIKLSTYMLYRIYFLIVIQLQLIIYMHTSWLLALQPLILLPLQGRSQTSDVLAHIFYKTL